MDPDPVDCHVMVTRSPAANEVAAPAVAVHPFPLVATVQVAITAPPFLEKETIQVPGFGAVSAYAWIVLSDRGDARMTLYVLVLPLLGLAIVAAPLLHSRKFGPVAPVAPWTPWFPWMPWMPVLPVVPWLPVAPGAPVAR